MKPFISLVLLGTCLICHCATPTEVDWDVKLHAELEQMAAHLDAVLKPWIVPEKVFRVEDFGAVGDGQSINTKAINLAIESCATNGGGVVLFSHGDYVSGT